MQVAYQDCVQGAAFLDVENNNANITDFLDSEAELLLRSGITHADKDTMRDVVCRIRKQTRFIVRSLRCWKERHKDYDSRLWLRYSAYEGALCYSDLRRHWAYYRHAMRELGKML